MNPTLHFNLINTFYQKPNRSDVLEICCGIELLVANYGSVIHVDSALNHHFELS